MKVIFLNKKTVKEFSLIMAVFGIIIIIEETLDHPISGFVRAMLNIV